MGRYPNDTSPINVAPILGLVAVVLLTVAFVIWSCNSSNVVTPAGYVGYVTQHSLYGSTKFVEMQYGPSSTGKTWMIDAQNVSITPFTYTETFKNEDRSAIQAKDGLAVTFEVYVTWNVAKDQVKEFVEKYSTMQKGDDPNAIVQAAYDNFIKEPIRMYARDEIQKYNALDIKDNVPDISKTLNEKVAKLTMGTPFNVTNIAIGSVLPPQSVVDAIALKVAKTQEKQAALIDAEIATNRAAARENEAKGVANANGTINKKLTPEYLQYEAIQAQKAMVNSPNHTTIYIPTGLMGVPVIQAAPANQ